MIVPQVALAQVDSVYASEGALGVVFPHLAMLGGIRVRVAFPGASARTGAFSLPRRGDWGIVAFYQNDVRSCVWIITLPDLNWTSIPGEIFKSDPLAHVEYGEDGSQRIRYSSGDLEHVWPDGTLFRRSHTKDGSKSNVTRRVKVTPRKVSEPQGEDRTATRTDYAPSTLPPADLVLKHVSGTLITVTADGSVSVVTARGHTLRLYDATEKTRDPGDGHVTGKPDEDAGRKASEIELRTERGHRLLLHDDPAAAAASLTTAGGLSVLLDDKAKTVTVHGETVVVDASKVLLGSANASKLVVLNGDTCIDPDGTNSIAQSSATKVFGE